MRTELLPENLAEFQDRFGVFHDGGVHYVKFDLFSTQRHINPYIATVVIGTRDEKQEGDDKWVNLTLEIVDITKLLLRKGRDYDFSIILCSNIAFFDNEVYLDIFSFRGKPTSPADFEDEADTKKFLIVGKRCFWYVSPFEEREIREW